VGLVAVMGVASLVRGVAFDAKRVPAEAKWLLHVDMDALKASKIWQMLAPKLDANPGFNEAVQNVGMLTGFRFPQDLHDVTLFGQSFTEEAVVVLIHAEVDQAKVLTTLAMAEGYRSVKYGQHEVHAWQDKGKQLYGAFASAKVVAIGRSQENMEKAIDLVNGKGESIQAEGGLAAGAKASVIVYVAGEGLAQLRQAQGAKTPLLNDAEMAWVSLGEQEDSVVLRGAVGAKTPQTAEQMRASVEGIKAMVSLAAANENADPKAKAAATAMQNLTAKVREKTLNVEWRVPIDLIRSLINRGENKAAAEANPPAAPKPQQ
jgi:hypothetical protein